MNWSLLNCFPRTKIPPHWYGYGEIRIWLTVPLKDMLMEGESREIQRIKGWRLWMSQSCFSLGFLSQNSFWKLLTFRGYKVFIVVCMRNVKSQFQPNRAFWRLELVTGTSCEFESRANCMARLEVLSCRAPAVVTF